ncbi:TPA: hypothetical protein ACVFIV_004638, partial [Pseudomonas aeruginosa]
LHEKHPHIYALSRLVICQSELNSSSGTSEYCYPHVRPQAADMPSAGQREARRAPGQIAPEQD